MATVTDVLETLITLKGAEVVAEGLAQMSESLLKTAEHGHALEEAEKGLHSAHLALLAPLTAMVVQQKVLAADLVRTIAGFGAVATEMGVATAAAFTLEAAWGLLTAPLTLIVLGLGAVTAGAALAGESLSAFSKSEASLARTALQLKNLKGSIPLKELTEFSDHLSELTGINHNAIATLGATASQFGLTAEQVKKLLPTVLDISQAKNLDPERVLKTLLRASRGRPQGLLALGIDPKLIHGDLTNVNNLIEQVGKGFAGTAEAFRNTLPGTTSALGDAIEHLKEALGRFISPVVVPILNLMIKGVDKLTEQLNRWAEFFHLPTAADLADKAKENSLALKGDPEQTEYQRQTAANTAKTADAFVKGVLGGAGTVAKAAMTIRDAKLAFGI